MNIDEIMQLEGYSKINALEEFKIPETESECKTALELMNYQPRTNRLEKNLRSAQNQIIHAQSIIQSGKEMVEQAEKAIIRAWQLELQSVIDAEIRRELRGEAVKRAEREQTLAQIRLLTAKL